MRARLLADRAGRLASADKSEVKGSTFLRELNLTPSEVSKPRPNQNVYPDIASHLRTVALRELADMGYSRSDNSIITVAQKQGVDFSADEPAKLKARLTPMTSVARLDFILDTLQAERGITPILYYTIQLAGNEGFIASGNAANRIRLMLSRSKDDQETFVGLGPLMEVVLCVGDTKQLPLLEELSKSGNTYVRNKAGSALHILKTRGPITFAVGY